jgi:hypothetical protein
MEKVSILGLMVDGMKVPTTKTRSKDKEHTHGQTVRNTPVAGAMASKTEKENSPIPSYKEEAESGKQAKE